MLEGLLVARGRAHRTSSRTRRPKPDLVRPRRPARPALTSRSTRRPRRTSTTRSRCRRKADGFRWWVHIADVSAYFAAGVPLDRGAAGARVLDVRPGPGRADAAAGAVREPLQLAAERGPALRHRRDAAERRADVLPLDHPQPTRGSPTARQSGGRPSRRSSRQLELTDRLTAAMRDRRFARGALAHRDAGDQLRVRRQGRRRPRLEGDRADGAPADRGADDRRQRGRRRAALRRKRRGALPRPRAARPAGDRAPAEEARRSGRADAASARAAFARDGGGGRRRTSSERVMDYVERSGRGREAFPSLVLRSLEAGPLRPARTSATPASRARRTATSPRRSAAIRTSSSTVRSLRELGLADEPPPADLEGLAEHTSAREREAAQVEYLADDICLAWLLEATLLRARAGTTRSRARSSG